MRCLVARSMRATTDGRIHEGAWLWGAHALPCTPPCAPSPTPHNHPCPRSLAPCHTQAASWRTIWGWGKPCRSEQALHHLHCPACLLAWQRNTGRGARWHALNFVTFQPCMPCHRARMPTSVRRDRHAVFRLRSVVIWWRGIWHTTTWRPAAKLQLHVTMPAACYICCCGGLEGATPILVTDRAACLASPRLRRTPAWALAAWLAGWLQGITLLWTLLTCGHELLGGTPMAKRAIIVCPTSLVSNWDNECTKWLKARRAPWPGGGGEVCVLLCSGMWRRQGPGLRLPPVCSYL